MKAELLPRSRLYTLSDFHRTAGKQQDAFLKKSIEEGGIQQPLLVLPDGDRYLVVDGIRRMQLAKIIGIAKVPAVVGKVPEGETLEGYARRIRLTSDLRQDLTPSQQADFIDVLKKQFGLTNTAAAQYLGVDQDTITNWMAVRQYQPEIVQAIDRGEVTMMAARVFNGMSPYGQQKVWKAHRDELAGPGASQLYKALRAKYPPEKFPKYYKEPDKIAARQKGKKRQKGTPAKRPAKPSYTPAEKSRLMTSFSFKESEVKTAKNELATLKRELTVAAPIIHAIHRNPKLWALVPPEMQSEFEHFVTLPY